MDVLAPYDADDMALEQHRIYRGRSGILQDHVSNIGTASDLTAQTEARLRLQPSPPRSRESDSPPYPPTSPPQ